MTLSVLQAAVRSGDVIFTLPRPNRHHNILHAMHALGLKPGHVWLEAVPRGGSVTY